MRGRLKIDAAGEEGEGYVSRDLQAMVMILEAHFKGNGEALESFMSLREMTFCH